MTPAPLIDGRLLAWAGPLWWFTDQVMAALPPPEDGGRYLVADTTFKGQTGQKHSLAKKGWRNEYAPSTFGLRIVVVMLHWEDYRIPTDFEIA